MAKASDQPAAIDGFDLTFPSETADCVRQHYAEADVILEYGSGGSSFVGLGAGAALLMTVESDKAWADRINAALATRFEPARFLVHHVDVGPTREWGFPVDARRFRNFHAYALSVFDQPAYRHPDVVLIDGRFRVACFYATMLRIERPATILFDDYANRKRYHRVERFFKPVAFAGRMAQFEINPITLPRDQMTEIIGAFSNAW